MTKSELRKSFLAKRQSITSFERDVASAEIVANFFNSFDFSKIKILHCFISIQRLGEVNTRPIFERVWSDFPAIDTVVPRVNHETEELESLFYRPDTELIHNRWQIGEPGHEDKVEPGEIDIVLVPLLCFDLGGHRVGYGKGYYDRFLARCRSDCQKVGLSMFPPIEQIPDARESDVRLDACVTPTDIFTFQRSISRA
jgi:5-formyltetrahydrofolate cyclo-ligase